MESQWLWLDQDLVDHTEILVQQNVAVKQESTRSGRVAEIHAQLHAVERPFAFPIGNLNGVPQITVRGRLSVNLHNPKMYLVDVESMSFQGAILDGPIFNRSDFCRNDGLLVGLKDLLLLSIHGDVELNRTVGAAEFFGKKELALDGCQLLCKVEELCSVC